MMRTLMPLLAGSTRLEHLTLKGCDFDAGSNEWLRLAPKTLHLLDLSNISLEKDAADLSSAVKHLRDLTSLYINMNEGVFGGGGFPAALTSCTALRRLAVTDGFPNVLRMLKSISRLDRLELLLLRYVEIIALPSSISG